ncbi:hypothetical protein OX459_08375 [Janthinobacterium sp. SUN026]|uniref:hypothetical protein n=1 Tax=Janthinobacterium sp. SUN026 TaxID=3002438 RepID=UPI0025B1B4F9|nr:hypothetical protein [Janthinobacterium sp. SUN026]MDN2671404.1 hypothetical protein [Janthinobacterium sp. SUN026]
MSIFFNTAAGHRLVDGVNLVPEFIGRVTLGPTPMVTSDGAESDYLSHSYSGRLPATNGQPYMVFWTFPVTDADIWWWPQDQFGFGGSALIYTGIVALHAASTPTPSVLPVGYVFSLGPVEISSASMATRLWNSSGQLLFDSGKLHLALQQVVSGLAVGYAESSIELPGIVANPAFLVPSIYRDRETYSRDAPRASFTEWLACYRRTGARISSRMVLVNDFQVPPKQRGGYFEDQTYGNTSGLVLPVLDASIYD